MRDLTLRDFDQIVQDVLHTVRRQQCSPQEAIRLVEEHVWETRFSRDIKHAILIDLAVTHGVE